MSYEYSGAAEEPPKSLGHGIPDHLHWQMECFKRQYMQMIPVKELLFPAHDGLLVEERIQASLYESVFKPGALVYAPPTRYQYRVLKRLTEWIEALITDLDEQEVSGDLLTCLTANLPTAGSSEYSSVQDKAYVTYTLPSLSWNTVNHGSITMAENRALIAGSGTTGLRTWEAALHLGAYLTLYQTGPPGTNQNLSVIYEGITKGKRILELGAGTGFLSILCAKYLGADAIMATDGDVNIVSKINDNFQINHLGGHEAFQAEVLDWNMSLPLPQIKGWSNGHDIDVILGADITYDPEVIPSLINTLHSLFECYPNVTAIISATLRNEQTWTTFLNSLDPSRFAWALINSDWNSPSRQQNGFFCSKGEVPAVAIIRIIKRHLDAPIIP